MTCSEYLCAPIHTHRYIYIYVICIYIIIYTSHVYRYGVSMGMDQMSAAPHGKLMSGSPHIT